MTLAAPAVIEPLDYERILTDTKARIVALWPDAAPALTLESEPLAILAQAFAYRELLYRQRINVAAAAQYIGTATGSDLDHKADFYGVTRLPGESDDRLRLRLRAAIAGLAGNGTAPAYEARALAAHPGIAQARAVQVEPGRVRVVVWPAPGQDAAAVLQAATAALLSDTARVLGVQVEVATARSVPINVRARITPEPHAPADLADRLRAGLAAALLAQPLGRPVARAWVAAQLYQPGVAAVQFVGPSDPPDLLPIAPDEYAELATVDIAIAA